MEAHDPKPLEWWYERRDDIDFEADYQRRGGIWAPKAKAYLIDSILNRYDIPKIYVADFTRADSPLNKNKKMYAIIDGKQRFEAVFDFFDEKLALDSKFVYQGDSSLDLRRLCYSDLRSRHPSVCSVFDNYELAVMSVITDEEGKLEELYVRLNKNSKALTGAEVRNAMPGIVPVLARELPEHAFFASKIKFTVLRYQDRDVAAKLLLIEYSGKLVSTKKKDLDRFAEQITLEEGPDTEPYQKAAAQARTVLDTMAKVFADDDVLLGGQGIVPVYYWLVKEYGKRHKDLIRPFLVEFEQGRKENDRRARDGGKDVDRQLLRYSNVKRSHNDEGAMREMYDVLAGRFEGFLQR